MRDVLLLSLLTSAPYFLRAALMRSLTSLSVTPFMGYIAAFFGMLMYDQAARQCASLSMGYLPLRGSAYLTSPYGFAALVSARSAVVVTADLPVAFFSIAAWVAGQMPSAS